MSRVVQLKKMLGMRLLLGQTSHAPGWTRDGCSSRSLSMPHSNPTVRCARSLGCSGLQGLSEYLRLQKRLDVFDVQVRRNSSRTFSQSLARMASEVGRSGICDILIFYIIKQLTAAAPRI